MTQIIDQRLWIAVHLLYPNSSQALDIYYTILGTANQKNNENYSKTIFLKLENFFGKNSAVRSGQPFRVFENYRLDTWKILYQKSSKQHLLIIIGLLVFKFNIQELSTILKLTEQKARFFVNQVFKKISDSKQQNLTEENAFKFKKIDDKNVSYFFMTENLVGYCLDILSPKDKSIVKMGLAIYPELNLLKQKYLETVEEFQQLSNLKLESAENTLVEPVEKNHQTSAGPKVKFQKSLIVASTVCVLFISLMVIRPFSFKNFPIQLGNKSVKMLEIKGQDFRDENTVELDGSSPVNLSEMPVSNATKPVNGVKPQINKMGQSEKKVALALNKPEIPSDTKDVPPSKQGGLFRASIQVSDIDTLSARITEKLVALGSTKAGEVELGWKKSPNVLYYHLVLPTENVDQAKDFLNKFGRLNIQFENHPRLMPVGFKRMILEVKEGE